VDFTETDAAIAGGDRPAILRYLAGEFNETKGGPPIGARVAIVEGKFENWLATVTAREKGGHLTIKILGSNLHVNRMSPYAIRPAAGFDLARAWPDHKPSKVLRG
jgi:hypothetical protein